MLTIISVSHMSEDQLARLCPDKIPTNIQLFFDLHARERGLPPLIVYIDPKTEEFVALSRTPETALPGTWVARLPQAAQDLIDEHGLLRSG